MKKLLSILLCGLLLLFSLVSCNNDMTDDSNEASSQPPISSEEESLTENSTENSSIVENSEETSQEPEPFISEIPEKAVYYTSRYSGDNWYSDPILNNENLREVYSQRTNEGLTEYFKNNDVCDDTYFLVGMMASTYYIDLEYLSNLSEDEGRELMRMILEPYDFIEWENHRMLFDQNYHDEWLAWYDRISNAKTESETLESYYASYAMLKRYSHKRLPNVEFPDVSNIDNLPEHEDMKYSYYSECISSRFDIIGYISAKDLKQLSEDLKDGEQVVCVTWFPAPDDQERWLTVNFRLNWKNKGN